MHFLFTGAIGRPGCSRRAFRAVATSETPTASPGAHRVSRPWPKFSVFTPKKTQVALRRRPAVCSPAGADLLHKNRPERGAQPGLRPPVRVAAPASAHAPARALALPPAGPRGLCDVTRTRRRASGWR